MRVAELYAPRRFRLVEQPPPEPGPGEVQARVLAVGVCGSDRHYYLAGGIGDTPCEYPMVLGHEPVGVVTQAGPAVSGWGPGDRVLLDPSIYCYQCEYCLSGRRNLCAQLRFMSMPGEPGFFRDYVTLPARNLIRLPPELSPEVGTLFEPLAVVLHSMQFAAPGPGQRIAVFGAGPIGLMTIAVLKLWGTSRIWAVEPVAHRRELARKMGADAVLDPGAADPVAEILTESKGGGVDVAIDCATQGPSLNQCLQVARPGGRIVITGIPVEVQVALDFHHMRRKELALYNVRRSNRESELAVELLRTHTALFRPIVTHTLPLPEIQRGFAMLEDYSDGVGKLVFQLA